MGIMSKSKVEPNLEHWIMVIVHNRHLLDLKLGDRYIGCGGKF
jgi:hypothetical protein